MKKSLSNQIKEFFAIWEFLLYVFLLFMLGFGVSYLVFNHFFTSLLIGLVVMMFFLFVFILPNRKLKRYQHDLNELLKYVVNMSFFLQSGENVLHSLIATSRTVHKNIQKDIDVVIEKLEKEAVLDTSVFNKYKFPALDQFNHNLKIKYEHGGEANELFGEIQKDMVYELKKRDELYKKRKLFSINVYFLLSSVSSILVILKYTAPFVWNIFLEMNFVSIPVIIITLLAVLANLYFLQKKNLNISVRV